MTAIIEQQYVHDVYKKIASHFDKTRFSQWNLVLQFLNKLPSYSVVLDNGCGNGKYLPYRKDLTMVGNDICRELLEIIPTKINGANLVHVNGLYLPYRGNTFDAIISIAVLHHLFTHEHRVLFVNQMVQCLKPNGLCFITVWAMEQENSKVFQKWESMDHKNDYFIPWHDTFGKLISKRYYHLFDKEEVYHFFKEFSNLEVISIDYEKSNWCITLRKTLI